MTKREIGPSVAILSLASLVMPSTAQTSVSDQRNAQSTAEVAKETSNLPLAEILRRIPLNLVDPQSIPSVYSSNPDVLAAALPTARLQAWAFSNITPEILYDPRVRNAVVELALSERVRIPAPIATHVYNSPVFIERLSTSVPSSEPGNWYPISTGLVTLADNKMIEGSLMRSIIVPKLAERLDVLIKSELSSKSADLGERLERLFSQMPANLVTETAIQDVLRKNLKEFPEKTRIHLVQWYRAFGADLDPTVASANTVRGPGQPEALDEMNLFPKLTVDEWMEMIKKDQPRALGKLTEKIFQNPEAAAIVRAILLDDITKVKHIKLNFYKGIALRDPSFEALINEALTSPKNLDRVIDSINSDICNLGFYPPVVSSNPTIAHATRVKVNKLLEANSEPDKRDDFSFVNLLEFHGDTIPDLLIFSKPSLHGSDTSMLVNPRLFSHWVGLGSRLHEKYLEQWNTVNKVADLLNIKSFDRFDNFRAIVRGRYLIETEEVRGELKKLLGESYFVGIDKDTRPLCFVAYAKPITDHNSAFLAHEQTLFSLDTIDFLTSYYRVIYIEPEYDYQIVESAERLHSVTGEYPEEAIFAAHGSSLRLMYSNQRGYSEQIGDGGLSIDDQRLIEEFPRVFGPKCRKFLSSCSTAKPDPKLGTCIAEVIAKACPGAVLVAPSDDAGVIFSFNRTGSIADVEFIGARPITFKADGTREEGPFRSRIVTRSPREIFVTYLDLWRTHPAPALAFTYLVASGIYSICKTSWRFGRSKIVGRQK